MLSPKYTSLVTDLPKEYAKGLVGCTTDEAFHGALKTMHGKKRYNKLLTTEQAEQVDQCLAKSVSASVPCPVEPSPLSTFLSSTKTPKPLEKREPVLAVRSTKTAGKSTAPSTSKKPSDSDRFKQLAAVIRKHSRPPPKPT
jgi:hypothetical protein